MEKEVKEYVCLVCKENGEEKKFGSMQGLSRHLTYSYNDENHKYTAKDYYDKYLKQENEGRCQNPNCPYGNPETSFQSITKGYSVGCCNSCSQLVPAVREKTETTNFRIYGSKSPTENKDVQEKQKATCKENHGEDNPMKVKEIKDKSISTRGPMQKEIQKNRERKCEEKHGDGIINQMYRDEIKKKLSDLHIKESQDRIIKLLNNLGLSVLEYTKCSSKCKLKCNNCGNIFEANPNHLFDTRRQNYCMKCAEQRYGRTQREIAEFCKQFYNVIENDRSVLDGLEIDILIPEKNIGIEYDGFYWHCETSGGKNRNYHLNKTKSAKDKNIMLIHIFEDEWLFKRDIVESILKSKLNVLDNSIFARNCEVIKLDTPDAKDFYNFNHLQGYSPGEHTALIYKGDIVSCITIGNPRFNKHYKSEIIRFCNKKFTSVTGGLSKLLSHILTDDNNSIITYADARYGNGNSYLNCGFKYIGMSDPNYYYIKNYRKESRMKYQKHKLEKLLETFNLDLTEWENMKLNGFDRIWDCGNYIFEWR